jgi:hypothetical protein
MLAWPGVLAGSTQVARAERVEQAGGQAAPLLIAVPPSTSRPGIDLGPQDVSGPYSAPAVWIDPEQNKNIQLRI